MADFEPGQTIERRPWTPGVDLPCQVTFLRLGEEVPEGHAYGSRDSDAYQGQRYPLKRDGAER